MSDRPGLSYDLIIELRDSLHKDLPKSEAVRLVRDYWNKDKNREARSLKESRTESDERISSFVVFFEEFRGGVIERASNSPAEWRALREWAFHEVCAGRDVPKDVLKILLRPDGEPVRRGRPGQYPRDYFSEGMLYWCVFFLREKTNFSSLATNDTSGEGAFSVVAEATGLDSEKVRDAWRKGKTRYS